MASLAQVRAAVEAQIEARLPAITARQEQFFAARGRYLQLLWTHSVDPAEGESTLPDRLADKIDEFAWSDLPWDLSDLKMNVACDRYQSPLGHGWVLSIKAVANGVTYTRAVNVGPDASQEQDWARRPRD